MSVNIYVGCPIVSGKTILKKKTLKCCCTSCLPNLFALARIFRDFSHVTARNFCAHARNLHAHAGNSAHTAHEILMPFITHKNHECQNSKNYLFWLDDLDLWTCPRYYQGQSLYRISRLYAKWFSGESANRHTDTHTHRRLRFYNLDRWRGR